MIESILRLAIERRFLFLSFILVIVGIGVWSYQKLPIDAVPDITNVQVQINTSAAAKMSKNLNKAKNRGKKKKNSTGKKKL